MQLGKSFSLRGFLLCKKSSELFYQMYQIKRKWIWFLIFLGPIGVISLQACNFFLRYDWLTKKYAKDLWIGFISQAQPLALTTLILGITIVTSLIAHIEHH